MSAFMTKKQIARRRHLAYLKHKQSQYEDDFNHIESYPLTQEQIKAVIWDQDHVLLVAAAGSGKSSTIIAKLYFLLKEGVLLSEICCFAYNTEAALELNERIDSMYQHFSLPGNAVQASTFHAFGMQVIAAATQVKPSISKLATSNNALYEFFQHTTQHLRQTDATFAKDFNHFMLLHEVDPAPVDGFTSQKEYEDYMRQLNATKVYSPNSQKHEWRLHTLNGLQVASVEERAIVNWLVINGVVFEYEKRFEQDTATEDKRQYFPDFYYPEQAVWHEHFAINEHGNAPDIFSTGSKEYEQGVKWKRELHQQNQTAFFETTSHDVKEGRVFEVLAKQLKAFNIPLNPLSPDEVDTLVSKAFNPKKDLDVFIQCLKHCKTNHLSMDSLKKIIHQSGDVRAKAFFRLFNAYYTVYEAHLQQEQCIDFDDLLHQAAGHIERNEYTIPLKYVLVDEAQDMSSSRARLVKALTNSTGCRVFAVGDDWQSIYRFSGADIAIMTDFQRHFGHAEQLVLTNTFRSNQNIVDVASDFIQKNPKQLKKHVTAHIQSDKQSVLLADYHLHNDIEKLHQFLAGCNFQAKQADEKRTVFLLTRYNNQLPEYLGQLTTTYPHLSIKWSTIHSCKGLEADYIIVMHVNSGTFGFPQTMNIDPLLAYVMPATECYPHAEERRLMYVALTRAKRAVLVLFKADSPSLFVMELARHPKVFGFKTSLTHLNVTHCPKCVTGQLSFKKGPYGVFQSCSHYPLCDYSKALDCPACGDGKIVKKKNKKGAFFYSCNQYPKCKFTFKN
jgi:DNA helicase IV